MRKSSNMLGRANSISRMLFFEIRTIYCRMTIRDLEIAGPNKHINLQKSNILYNSEGIYFKYSSKNLSCSHNRWRIFSRAT